MVISLDFIIGLAKTSRQHDSIMAMVDKLSKATHFIPVRYVHKASDITHFFMKEVLRSHGVPKSIVLDQMPHLLLSFGGIFLRI